MVDSGKGRATAGHCRPNHNGNHRYHTGEDARDKNLNERGNPKAGEGLSTLGVPIPPFPGSPNISCPIPVGFQCVEHDERKHRRNEYYPAGDTINGMVEGGNWRATEGNCRPH